MPTERDPSTVYWLRNNLYLNTTNRCSNNCYFCVRNFMNGVGGFNLKLKSDPTAAQVKNELQETINTRSWEEIVFCGFGEPTARLDCLLQVVNWIRSYYAKPISIRIDTNGQGYLLNKGRDVIKELIAARVDRISVSLNAHDKETYNQVCRTMFSDAYESVQEFIERAKGNFDLEVTAVAIPEVNIPKLRDTAQRIGVKLRIRECVQGFM